MFEKNMVLGNLLTEEVTLPSGAVATIREMTGREEDILSNEQAAKKGKSTEMVLQNVILQLNGEKPTDSDIADMYTIDREAAMIVMRKLSYGNVVESEIVCDSCKKSFSVSVDLDNLEYIQPPEDGNFDTQIRLSDGETIVTLKAITGNDERKLFQSLQEGKDLISSVLLANIKDVSGIKRVEIRPWLQNLRVRDRSILRKAVENKRMGYKTDFRCTCPNCNAENRASVTQISGFFFPQEPQE